MKEQFAENEGSFLDFARSYKKFGLNINEKGDLVYREWAPGAKGLSLVNFNSNNLNSLETSMDGTGRVTSVRRMIMAFGLLRFQKIAMENSLLSMKAGLNVVLLHQMANG